VTAVAVEVVGVLPPANYPGAEWLPVGDYFHVRAELRGWYSLPDAGPTKRHLDQLDKPRYGMAPEVVPVIVIDSKGRHVESAQLEAGPIRFQQREIVAETVAVDFRTSSTSLAWRTWEHGIRLGFALRAEADRASKDAIYASAVAKACAVCGDATAGARQLCHHCSDAVASVAAVRYYDQHRKAIDAYLDAHPDDWTPRPPRRDLAVGTHH
jgi:hypothetical protein